MIIERKILKNVLESIDFISVTAIIGPRQVGKTTLAKQIKPRFKKVKYLDLEKKSDLDLLIDAERYFNLNKDVNLFCIDEIQLKPNLFSVLRSFVDENKSIRFLILGSATPELLRQTAQTLAGRIFYNTLNPFQYLEIEPENIPLNDYHLKGGFPNSILTKNDTNSFLWRENFITTFLEKDLLMFGFNLSSKTIHRLWIMLAHLNGQVLKYSTLSKSLGIDAKTVKKYIDILHQTFMIRILEPYHINVKKRLIKSPKIYFKDTGILHCLLRIKNYEELYSNPYFGSSWEALVVENIINQFKDWECFYYRTIGGSELDLVLVKGLEIIAIEIKSSLSPKVSRGFWTAIEDIKATSSYIIAPVKEPYPYKNNVMVYPLNEFLKLDL
ncbi:MAG: ATP-binding protein [Flavobacteriaceae bacterium]|nr:ATP-binding protein [Flavobacteriaceae bacterium]